MMVDIPKLVKRMSQLRHFKDLSLGDIRTIIGDGRFKKYLTGNVIILEEQPCSGLFVLLRGMVHLYRMGPDSQEVLVDVVKPITMFNEVAVLDGGSNPLTAIAAQDCVVWNSSYDSLLHLAKRYPQVALGFLPIIAARNRALIAMVTDVCFLSVRARTAKLILDLSDQGRQPIVRRDHPIYQMSAQISTVPEAISRSLGYLRDEGCITTSRTTITVREPERLARVAQVEVNSPTA